MNKYKNGKILKDKLYRWILKMLVVISKVSKILNII